MFAAKLNSWLLYCAFVLAASAMVWVYPGSYRVSGDLVSATDDSSSGELLAVKTSVFSAQGDRLYHLESDRLDYFSDQTFLKPLQVVYQSDDGKEIMLRSQSGRMLHGGDFVNLEGEVEIEYFSAAGNRIESAHTSDVGIDVKKQLAQTSAYAVIKRSDHTVSGDGLEVDIEKGTMRLLNNVKVNHER